MTETYRREDVQRYLADELSPEERQRVEEHLSRCRDCRRLLTTSLDAAAPVEPVTVPPELVERVRAKPPRSYRPFLLAAALVVAALGFGLWERLQPSVQAPGEWRSTPEAPSGLAALEPADGARVGVGEVTFRWTDSGAWRYTLVVINVGGVVKHRLETQETELRVDLWAQTAEGTETEEALFWYVTADWDDGTSASTKTRRLVMGR